MQPPQNEITQLLRQWSDGDRTALDQLMPVVHQELRKLANSYLRGERPGHTLQPTALINEAYLRLVGQNFPEWQSRKHFYGVAAQLMRQILVEHARGRAAACRSRCRRASARPGRAIPPPSSAPTSASTG